MKIVCEVCGVEFEGRSDAVCCGAVCRVKRNRGVTDNGLSVTSVTDKSSSVTDNVTDNVTDKIEVACREMREGIWIDVEKDLGLDLKKDLGCRGWDKNGIHILPEISIEQVRDIARLVAAKHGRGVNFYEARL